MTSEPFYNKKKSILDRTLGEILLTPIARVLLWICKLGTKKKEKV